MTPKDVYSPIDIRQIKIGGEIGRRIEASARWTIAMMEDAGYGWMGWGMREGRAISTRRDRYDGNGIDGQGFHAWFTRDGSLRPGLEFLSDRPRFQRPLR